MGFGTSSGMEFQGPRSTAEDVPALLLPHYNTVCFQVPGERW